MLIYNLRMVEFFRLLRKTTERVLLIVLCSQAYPELIKAEDWPQWRGKERLGIWNETDILDRFPSEGLSVRWRTPVGSGFSGPAVSEGRVFLLDYLENKESDFMEGTERLLCIDQSTGKILWTHEWKTNYRKLMASYATGPRATPTVDGKRVYVVGATGILRCLDVKTSKLLWEKNYVRDFNTRLPTWGVVSAPLVDGNRLICIVGGKPNAKVMAFDKFTGEELWRALSSDWEMGYAQPIIFHAGGVPQLIIWHPKALTSLNPLTGDIYWEQPFEVPFGMTVATPVKSDSYLLVSQFYGGSMMMKLGSNKPTAKMLWKGKSRSELPDKTEGLHTLLTTPIIEGNYIYGICSYGQLRCLRIRDGVRVWQSLQMTDFARWAAAFLVRNGDRYFINNDKGDLIIARFGPKGYVEVDRTKIIEPTSNGSYGKSRFSRMVNWSHPAYANRHIFARNDHEILCASLEK